MKITAKQLRQIIREESSKVLREVSMTSSDILDDIDGWSNGMSDLAAAAYLGNLETPDMGGLDVDHQAKLSEILNNAVSSLEMARSMLKGSSPSDEDLDDDYDTDLEDS